MLHGAWIISLLTFALWAIIVVDQVFSIIIAPNDFGIGWFGQLSFYSWAAIFILSLVFGFFGNRWARRYGLDADPSKVALVERRWSNWGYIVFIVELLVLEGFWWTTNDWVGSMYLFFALSIFIPVWLLYYIVKAVRRAVARRKSVTEKRTDAVT
jgi:ABC-type Na+ efflux pump permease subunit